MKVRDFLLHGYNIEVWNFGKQSFYYPSFNGNMEFRVSSKGFKELSSFIRTVKWADNIVKQSRIKLFGV